MKRFIVILVSFIIVLGSIIPAISADSSGSVKTGSTEQLEQLAALGVFSKNSSGDLEADKAITREAFAKVLLYISGQEDKAALYKNNTLFKDVKSNRWSNGYIGAAYTLGYLKPMPDGLFHPADAVTYTQAASVFVKLLGYTDSDLSGNWPYNYFNLMENLGIFEAGAYQAADSITREEMAVMLDRLLQTEIKGSDKLFVDTTDIFQNLVIFENSVIRKDIDSNRILTDKGEYFLKEGVSIPEAGRKYVARIEKGYVTKLAMSGLEYADLSVSSISEGMVVKNDGTQFKLPQNVQYYYNGKAVDFGAIAAAVQTNSSIVIGYKDEEVDYAVLFDPVYSKPAVVTSEMLGYNMEQLYGGKQITREGKSITTAMLELNDVIYEVSDIWGSYGYVEAYNSIVSGEITAILPNKVSPVSVAIDEKNYELSSYFEKTKLNMASTIEVGSNVDILLDSKGKVVDILLSGAELNQEYVLVLDATEEKPLYSRSNNKSTYYVTLMHTDGSVETYISADDRSYMKGNVAKYKLVSYGEVYDTIQLSPTEYSFVSNSVHEINKESRMLDDSYISDNVVIFNQINNIAGRKNDAAILEWEDLPDGKLEAGKVRYIHKTGDFGDIDILFVNNILEEQTAYGLVTKIISTSNSLLNGTTQTIELLINGKQYSYSGPETGASSGSVLKLMMSGDKILSVEKQITSNTFISSIDAVDSARIRFNGTTYKYHKDFELYKLEDWINWKAVDASRLEKGTVSGSVQVFFDKSIEYGGKVIMILIR
ncbi:MAG: S-layer protein [Clostridia bacterium]|nr:S-layer protein [Clostridia bacterium]